MANPREQSPLRYPGGKSCLTHFLTTLAQQNDLVGGQYLELYAGGAGAALNLLYNGVFREILINDYDYSIYSFWYAVLHETEAFIRLIEDTPITLAEWHRQKEILAGGRENDQLTLGFATFFLNRTNRSGIIFKAGPIGGLEQAGKYLIDVRFNKKKLIKRIEKIAQHGDRIHLTNENATSIIQDPGNYIENLTDSFIYLDPPYYNKGRQLYLNNYEHDGHADLARQMSRLPAEICWLISYDNTDQIKSMYRDYRMATFDLNYTLQSKRFGSELLIFSDNLTLDNEIMVNGRTGGLDVFRYQEHEPDNRIHIAR
ncbi:MAG: DNA adenine methylase [Chryseobacterium sp.]|nr:MAG: DNA adenine methylase [Chryseobacterium sp.]